MKNYLTPFKKILLIFLCKINKLMKHAYMLIRTILFKGENEISYAFRNFIILIIIFNFFSFKQRI